MPSHLKINFPMPLLSEPTHVVSHGEPNIVPKLSGIDRKAPFMHLYQTLTRLGHLVGAFPSDACDLNFFWTAKGVPESEKGKSIILELGWIPRWSYQVSPFGSNFQGHYARQYQYAPLNPGENNVILGYLNKLRCLFEQSINWGKVEQLRQRLKTPFVFFPFQLANDFNLKFSDTEFAHLYSAGPDQNIALAQACIDKVEAENGHMPVVYKQHPSDTTAHFRLKAGTGNHIIDNKDDISTHEIFATGLCQGVISVNSNSVHEAAVWNVPSICLGKLIWNKDTQKLPFPASLSALKDLPHWKPYDSAATLAYLYYLVRNQWALADFQNGLMVEALLSTRGLCEPHGLRKQYGLFAGESVPDGGTGSLAIKDVAIPPDATRIVIEPGRKTMDSPQLPNNICLASCFLYPTPEMVRVWNRFSEELEHVGYRLVMITGSSSPDLHFQQIVVPFWLDEFAGSFDRSGAVLEESVEIDALLERERHWARRPEVVRFDGLRGYAACKSFYTHIIEELRPSFCLSWGATLPQSRLFQQVAIASKVPFRVLERGFLAETLMIETEGNNALSDLTREPLRESVMAEADPAYYDAIKQYYLTKKPQKYDAPEFVDGPEFARSMGVEGQTIVAFFGQVDAGIGLIPRQLPASHLQSPIFSTSRDALCALADAVKERKGLALVFKPHPHDPVDYDAYGTDNVKIVHHANIHSILNAASVSAFISSTIQFEAMLYEKPLLLLANSELTGKGIGYECRSYEGLKMLLDQALARVDLAGRVERSRRFAVGVNKQFLYAYRDEVPSVRKLKDLASFVAATGVERNGEADSSPDAAQIVPWHEFLTRKQRRDAAEVESLYLRSQQLVQSGDLAEAMDTLQAIIALQPEHAVVHNDLGAIYIRKGDHRNALEHFNRAVAANERYLIARKNLADLQVYLKNFDEAACHYQFILSREPDDIDALSGLGRLGIEAGKLDSARYFFQRLVEVDPHQIGARQCLETLQRLEKESLAPPTSHHTVEL